MTTTGSKKRSKVVCMYEQIRVRNEVGHPYRGSYFQMLISILQPIISLYYCYYYVSIIYGFFCTNGIVWYVVTYQLVIYIICKIKRLMQLSWLIITLFKFLMTYERPRSLPKGSRPGRASIGRFNWRVKNGKCRTSRYSGKSWP